MRYLPKNLITKNVLRCCRENIAKNLNLTVNKDTFKVHNRSVRDRFKFLREKIVKKRNNEERATGIIGGEHNELDDALEELDTLFKESDQERDLMLEEKNLRLRKIGRKL